MNLTLASMVGAGVTAVHLASRPYWSHTGVRMKAGVSYLLTPKGRWHDASIDSGPEGYHSANVFQRMTEGLRRVGNAPWFALVGALDRDAGTQCVVGSGCVYQAVADGELTCFANDVRGFYWNNSGRIDLEVMEVSVEQSRGSPTCR